MLLFWPTVASCALLCHTLHLQLAGSECWVEFNCCWYSLTSIGSTFCCKLKICPHVSGSCWCQQLKEGYLSLLRRYSSWPLTIVLLKHFLSNSVMTADTELDYDCALRSYCKMCIYPGTTKPCTGSGAVMHRFICWFWHYIKGLFVYFTSFLTYLLCYLSTPSTIDLFHFQARGCKRPNLALVFCANFML